MAGQPSLDFRKKLLARVHIAQKDMALDDGTYRALLERVTGARSSTNLTTSQLDQVIAEFKRLGWADAKGRPARAGKRPMADAPMASKIRALWLNLYHLGELRDPSEDALAAFVAKETGVDALHWLKTEDADVAIRALQGWLDRVGYKRVSAERIRGINHARRNAGMPAEAAGFAFKVALIETQWKQLIGLGAMATGDNARLDTWLAKNYGVSSPAYLSPAQADAAIEELGRWVRRVQAKGARR